MNGSRLIPLDTHRAYETILVLLRRLDGLKNMRSSIIPWSCPVPSFGDPMTSKVATLGLNPSSREFVDVNGKELNGSIRRFHTLRSLNLTCWSKANVNHARLIMDSCQTYFSNNPYDVWFRRLDYLIAGTRASYYGRSKTACHLDLVPFATKSKWSELSLRERGLLLEISGDVLGSLVRDSKIQILMLNGNSVVQHFQKIVGIKLKKRSVPSWMLSRKSGVGVRGYAYSGEIKKISGVGLGRSVLVLGFNHNIQSSFGVTTNVRNAIRRWITSISSDVLS